MEVEEDVEELRIPYSQRPDWSDLSPLEVDDGNCVVAIQYSDEHRDALGLVSRDGIPPFFIQCLS
jgi:hypothetical protein